MRKYIYILLAFVGLISLLSSCKKDETKTVLKENPVPPSLTTVPNLKLERVNSANVLQFVGTEADFGFTASTTYYLEVDLAGNNFQKAVSITSHSTDTFNISVDAMNAILIRNYTADSTYAVQFRVRASLLVENSNPKPILAISDPVDVNVTTYGLPRLDLLNTQNQKIESPTGNGIYSGFVKLIAGQAFTLRDPDANITYGIGSAAGILGVNGTAIPVTPTGWYRLTVSTTAHTYTLEAYMIAIVGSASGGWDTNYGVDVDLDYDSKTGNWTRTVNLITGDCKFRMNDGWNNGFNLGLSDATHPGYTLTNLWNNSSSQNIPIAVPGSYTIVLHISDAPFWATFTRN
jgi:starch-binding outer membrane protein SusE/F